jgi:DNA-binding response OmpR family regulator
METNKRILIVDDEVDLLQMIAFQFTSKGFEVQTAGDGLEALQKVPVFRPDLIILDMNMPRMGGIEFYNKICGKDGKPMFPVLVLTARANVQGLFKDLEIDGFMTKPFEIDQLISQAELIIKEKIKKSAGVGLLGRPRKVCVVENNQNIFDQVSSIFLNADYTVIPARNGALGIEKMLGDVPDAAIVQLGLADIAGDIVIYRLSQMAKTMGVKFFLYTPRDLKHDEKVMERIGAKTGILTFVEYNTLEDLLAKVNQAFFETD